MAARAADHVWSLEEIAALPGLMRLALAPFFPRVKAEVDQHERRPPQTNPVQGVGERTERPEERQSSREERKPLPNVWVPVDHAEAGLVLARNQIDPLTIEYRNGPGVQGSPKWLWLENVLAGQRAQVAATPAECAYKVNGGCPPWGD